MNPLHQPLFLCLHIPEFPVQARLRHRPALRKKAVAILHGTPPLETVCSVTPAARMAGLHHGATRAELDSFPGIHALQRSEAEEGSAASALLMVLGKFSPRVEVLTVRGSAHRLVLDIAGTERIFGPSAQLAHDALQATRALGLAAHAAVCDNFHAAVCAAPYAGAKAHVITRGGRRAALASLPLKSLEGITEEQLATFALWGLHTLGEVAALDEAQLVARMGQAGKRVWLLSRGEHPHLMQPEEERFTLEERIGFDTPVEMLDSLLFVVSPMLDQLLLRAASRTLALASVTVRLGLTNHAAEETVAPQDAAAYIRTIKPALPLAESRVLLKLLHLELQAHPPGAPVISVELEAEPGDRARAQLGLFCPQTPEPSRLDVTLARLRALVGEGRVGRAKLLDSHQPESFLMERFSAPVLGAQRSITKPREQPASRTHISGLALRRMRPPVLLRMPFAQAQPQGFLWDGAKYEVSAAYGPWRHSGNWWSAAAWSHEEWDVTATATDGSTLLCRMTRDLLHRQWRLEGLYD